MRTFLNAGVKELLTSEQLKSVKSGDGSGEPGSCSDVWGPAVQCPENSPYCLTSQCTDNAGVTHYVSACSPTQEF